MQNVFNGPSEHKPAVQQPSSTGNYSSQDKKEQDDKEEEGHAIYLRLGVPTRHNTSHWSMASQFLIP